MLLKVNLHSAGYTARNILSDIQFELPEGRILALIDSFSARIDHLHISDNFGRRDDHLAVGDGGLDFRALAKALQRIEYDGTVTLEVFTGKRSDLVRSRLVLRTIMGAQRG